MRAFFAKLKNNKIVQISALILPIICLACLLIASMFTQTEYMIKDGDQVVVHSSYFSDPRMILFEAGVPLNDNDRYTMSTIGGVSEITIQRAIYVNLQNCGKSMKVSSYGESVQELLDRVGVPYGSGYRVSAELGAQTYDGMDLRVDAVVCREESYTLDIPFETICEYDPSMEEGQIKVLTQGQAGQKLLCAQITYINSNEESRTVLSEQVVTAPVDHVVAIGTGGNATLKPGAPIIGDGIIILPSGEVLTYTHTDQYVATAYHMSNAGCDEITATGSHVRVGVVAVDPKVIPYGTRMFIVSNDGKYIYGIGTAEDCGSSIKGNRLDLYFDTNAECWQFGIRNCTVYFLGRANWRDL